MKSEKDKYYMIPFSCGIEPKNNTNELINKTEIENELMAIGGKDQGEEKIGNLELTCTHCYI